VIRFPSDPFLPVPDEPAESYLSRLHRQLTSLFVKVAQVTHDLQLTTGFDATALQADIDDHAAATGTAVHGLGTMATQAAGAVAITGGTIANATITGGSNALLTTHAALTGSDAHGLGTISTQAANNVNIDGGSIDSTALTACTYTGNATNLNYEREAIVAKGNITASTAIDWNASGMVTATVTGAGATFTHSNLPNGVVGYMAVEVTNGGGATSLFTGAKWPDATPIAFTASGRDLVMLMCHDGTTVNVVGMLKAFG
jgi:hypothetical protein